MNYTYTVPEGIRYLRADKALALAFPDHSRTALQRAFDSGLVTLRGAAIKRDQSVTALDTLVCHQARSGLRSQVVKILN
jgi:23S rRNA pseudouridine1911/1915/1917 synthase